MFKTTQEFAFDLQTAYFLATEKHLAPTFLRFFVNVFISMYGVEFRYPIPSLSDEWLNKLRSKERLYHIFLKTCTESLIAFTNNAPDLWLEQPEPTSFLVQYEEMPIYDGNT